MKILQVSSNLPRYNSPMYYENFGRFVDSIYFDDITEEVCKEGKVSIECEFIEVESVEEDKKDKWQESYDV